MARAYDSGLFELEGEAGGIWGNGLGYGQEAGYSPLGYSPTPLDHPWFEQPQAKAKPAPLPPLPPLDPRPFGGNSQLQAAAQQLAQLRGSRVVKTEVERLYQVALQAAEQAARRARANVAAARAAVVRPDPAQVQAQKTAEYETWLTEDYRLTMEGARARYGESWRKQMRSLGPTERDAFYANTFARVCRAWLIARREQLDFNTLGAANLRSLQNFQPPAAQGGLIVSPLIPGSDEEPVAPIVVTFVQELKKRYRGFSAITYGNHGGGAFLRRGYSIDLFLNSPLDDRGFYARTAAEAFLSQVHEAARAVNVEWRVLYNDFAVADAINRATGVRHVFFIGSPLTVQRGGIKYGTGINWHGPAPLILHFHLDLVPLATTSGSGGAAESGLLGFQDAKGCQGLGDCGCNRCRRPHHESEWESEWEQPLPCPAPTSVTVSNFPRYRNTVGSLPPSERAKLRNIAELIKRSFRPGCHPIRTVSLVGHADRDVVRERTEPGFVVRISHERAVAVKHALEQLIANRGISSRVAWNVCGAGSSRLVVQNPSTEQARMRNRRVEIALSSTQQPLVRTARGSLVPAGLLVPGLFCQSGPTTSCLTNFPVPTAALGKPVRTLTRTEARDIVVHLVNQGILTLRDPPRFDSSCKLTRPSPTDLVILDPPFIDQVEFVGDSPGAKRGRAMTDMDMRMVVLLFYLSRTLRTTWGVTEIHHLGIGSSGTHVGRLAMDFSGVGGTISNSSTASLNGPFQLNIQKDWGDKSVVLPNGTQAPRWPNVFKGRPFNDTLYRLDPQQNPFANQTTPQSFLAMAIFRDVYNFATLHCTDTKPPGPPTTIGKSSRFIIHPDHTDPRLRGAHQNHIHMEIPL